MDFSKQRTNATAALITLVVLAFVAMPLLNVLRHERPWSSLMLLLIAFVAAFRLVATLRQRNRLPQARLLATRDLTTVVAALLACIATSTGFSWARGAATVATEFVFLIEVLRHRAQALENTP